MNLDLQTEILCKMDDSLPFKAATVEEMYALLDLVELGYVEATITYDKNHVPNSGVGMRMTIAGRLALEERESAEYVLTEEDLLDRRDAVSRFYKAQEDFDKTMSVSSSGAIAIAFSLAGVMGVGKLLWYHWGLLIVAVGLWAWVLVSILSMYRLSVISHDRYIGDIDHGKRTQSTEKNEPAKKLRKANLIELVLFCLGIATFAAFMIVFAATGEKSEAGKGVVLEKTVSTNYNYRIRELLQDNSQK